MKKIVLSLGLAALVGGSASFAQTVATNPVGFITATVAGGSLASPTLTLLSPTLTQPVAYQGLISAITSSKITVSGTPWTSGQFDPDPSNTEAQYYVEVIHGSNAGVLANITAGTTNNSVNVDTNLTTFSITTGDTVIIRPHVTLSTLLGATNTFGLLAGASPGTADEVLIYDGANQVPYFYFTGDQVGDPAGWYDSAFTFAAADVPVPPHSGVIIKRKAAGNLTITVTGTVKTGNTLFPVYNGLNVLGTVSAQGLTLDTSGLYTGSSTTGVNPGASPGTADEVIIYSGNTQTPYFYFTGDQVGDGPGWYDSAFTTTAGSVPIAPGTAFVLKRKGSGVPFNWAIPAPTSF